MTRSAKEIAITILTSAPLWGAIGALGGAAFAYNQSNNSDRVGLAKEIVNSSKSSTEKIETIRVLVLAGLLQGVDKEELNTVLERAASTDATKVPTGLVCDAIWCSLRGQVRNVKLVYAKLGLFAGAVDDEVTTDFKNATVNYQVRAGMTADGIVGARTYAKIREDARSFEVALE